MERRERSERRASRQVGNDRRRRWTGVTATATAGVLAAVGAALAGCSATADSDDTAAGGQPAGGPNAASCPPALDAALGAWADAGFSGGVAVLDGGTPECLSAYGTADRERDQPVTVDTVFALGSVSKAFTAAAVLDLADAGALALDDQAGALLPGLEGPAAAVTVEQLLLHTGGLTGHVGEDHRPLTRAEAIAALNAAEPAFPPGTDFRYSDASYTLLALIVDERSERGHRAHLAEEILPLPDGTVAGGFWDGEPAAPGPRAVGHGENGPSEQRGDFAGPHWALAGTGDLAATTGQLAAWTDALFTGELLSPESTERVATPGFDHGDGRAESPGWVVLDAEVFGAPVLAVAGGGSATGQDVAVAWLPERERAVAIASNTQEITAEELLRAVGEALLTGGTPPAPELPAAEVDPAELAAVAGRYRLPDGGTFEVEAGENGLEVTPFGADAVAALHPPGGGFTADDLAAHERGVAGLLAGETPEGREELGLLEAELGSIGDVTFEGTVVAGGEVRTYVTVGGGDATLTLWYALDEGGAVAGAEGPASPPSLTLLPSTDGGYRPVDPAGGAPEVTATFGDGTLVLEGPGGAFTATAVPN
ncbi:serine hydrolase domain-containing protein [Streptomyces triticirhizae]|uniref:Class A beta-lactamase-related serine hydrolase n=1 Tax=Streptomyces triticirhizae TaxID=2483353 RepID=A0A3M2LTU9_9ACTN|nr:serine hydrolase domain-containing protein [Streptomyces triticirhizae]RMI39475.1 class A beta-lactamase-related serine hydrolase [Streptomyces triticirhizae]